jgi:hypothetical protein
MEFTVGMNAQTSTSIFRGEKKMRSITLASAIAILCAAGAYAQNADPRSNFVRALTSAEQQLQEQCFAALEVTDKAAKQGEHKSVDHGPGGCGPWEKYVRAHQKSLFGDQGN